MLTVYDYIMFFLLILLNLNYFECYVNKNWFAYTPTTTSCTWLSDYKLILLDCDSLNRRYFLVIKCNDQDRLKRKTDTSWVSFEFILMMRHIWIIDVEMTLCIKLATQETSTGLCSVLPGHRAKNRQVGNLYWFLSSKPINMNRWVKYIYIYWFLQSGALMLKWRFA